MHVQHKWGLLSMATQHVGDRIIWEDPENKIDSKTFPERIPEYRSVIVMGAITRCPKCYEKNVPHQRRCAFIEIENDEIKAAYSSATHDKALNLFERIVESDDFRIWDNNYRDKEHSLAILASFVPSLMPDYVKWLSDKHFLHRREIMAALQVMLHELRDEERMLARTGPRIGTPIELQFSKIVKAADLENLRKQVAAISDDSTDPMKDWAKSLLRDFPERIPE